MGMDAVTVTVTGSDSLWDNTGSLSVNQGALTVDDGGILETAWIQKNGSEMGSGSRTLSIDGGVLRANADEGSFLRNWAVGDVRIGAQGIIQDTNGFDIGIKSDLQSSEGGLTKVGAGTLTLTGAHNYGGDVMVKGGTLAIVDGGTVFNTQGRSEEHTSELQSLMRISYADFCLKKKNNKPSSTYSTQSC